MGKLAYCPVQAHIKKIKMRAIGQKVLIKIAIHIDNSMSVAI